MTQYGVSRGMPVLEKPGPALMTQTRDHDKQVPPEQRSAGRRAPSEGKALLVEPLGVEAQRRQVVLHTRHERHRAAHVCRQPGLQQLRHLHHDPWVSQ